MWYAGPFVLRTFPRCFVRSWAGATGRIIEGEGGLAQRDLPSAPGIPCERRFAGSRPLTLREGDGGCRWDGEKRRPLLILDGRFSRGAGGSRTAPTLRSLRFAKGGFGYFLFGMDSGGFWWRSVGCCFGAPSVFPVADPLLGDFYAEAGGVGWGYVAVFGGGHAGDAGDFF